MFRLVARNDSSRTGSLNQTPPGCWIPVFSSSESRWLLPIAPAIRRATHLAPDGTFPT